MERRNKLNVQLSVGENLIPVSRLLPVLCGECEGRGWIWVRSYEICPDCGGQGISKADPRETRGRHRTRPNR